MKRSANITLVLMSGFAVTALAGCDAEPAPVDEGGTFTSMAECVAIYDQQTCNTAQQLANKEHVQNAPKYNSQAACAAEYGADMCRPASAYGGSSNVFLPLMAGYMLGSAGSTPSPLYYGNRYERDRYGRSHGGQAPIFTSGRGFNNRTPIGAAPFQSTRPAATTVGSTKGGLKSTTALTPPSSQRGGFGTSFKPTQSFKSNYSAANPTSFGRAALPTTSARFASVTSARAASTSSGISARGGFGSTGRGFGGGFGG